MATSFSRQQKRWLWIGAYVAFWTVLAALASVEVFVMQQKWDKPVSWGIAARRAFEEVYSYGLMTVAILWFCGRIRFDLARRGRWFLAHMGFCAVFTLGAVTLIAWLWSGQRSVQSGEVLQFRELFPKLAASCALSSFYKYWIVVLGHLGWQYYLRYRDRERQAAALSAELVNARLEALRMQLNPHFLFNTLNAVLALIHEDPAAADRMLVQLSHLLRRTLDSGSAYEVPLREELQFLRMYLEIEQIRFQDRLQITFDIDPDTEDLLVPQLILQPLVENALRHGILPRDQPGQIHLRARQNGDRLELSVRDNGIGLPDPAETGTRKGVGLQNVRSRLNHLYGVTQFFQLREAPGGGAEAILSIPVRSKQTSDGAPALANSEPSMGVSSPRVAPVLSSNPTC
jgi:two-component system LytT family sensor kinase